MNSTVRLRREVAVAMRKVCATGVGALLACSVVLVAPADASDSRVAPNLVVTQADVGSDYFVAAATPNPPDTFAKVADCVGKPVPHRKVMTTLQGPALRTSSGVEITSSVDIVKTKAMAKADRAVVTNPKYVDCGRQVVQAQLGSQGVEVLDIHRGPSGVITGTKKYGTYSDELDSTFRVGNQVQTSADVEIAKGRAEVDVVLLSAPRPPDAADTTDATVFLAALDKLNQRLKAAKV